VRADTVGESAGCGDARVGNLLPQSFYTPYHVSPRRARVGNLHLKKDVMPVHSQGEQG